MSAGQKILMASEYYTELDRYFAGIGAKIILLVCGKSFSELRISRYFNTLEERTGIRSVRFSDFKPNPRYKDVVKGVRVFRENNCDSIIAVGGGSAIDVAKCIKLYSNMDPEKNYLDQVVVEQDIPLLAVPTTAGSGSEATRYAVIYYRREKQSVSHESCIPSAVLMDASALDSLPDYHKKSAMLDALCHAIESFWSVNSTIQSMEFSESAIRKILAAMDRYMAGDITGNRDMLAAANIAGKAINITQTTAGHAMCYKLTELYGIAHGHAAALCVSKLFAYMVNNMENCIDSRGKSHLEQVFLKIARSMGCLCVTEAVDKFNSIIDNLNMWTPVSEERDWEILKNSVNLVRLKNNPVALDVKAIDMLYHEILGRR